MSQNLQLYAVLYVTIDNTLLSEELSVEVNRSTGSQAISTTAKGYAGESQGAAMCEFHAKNVVPADGFEFDAGTKMKTLIPVEFGVPGPGGKTLITKGFIISDSIKHSTNSPTDYDFSGRGSFPVWQ